MKKENSRKYYLKNRSKILEKVKSYSIENKDKIKITSKKYRTSLHGKLISIFNAQMQRSKKNKGHKNLHKVEYTKDFFIERFLNDKKYISIYKDWENNNFIKEKSPSIDRINPHIGYTIDNIQMVTWKENFEKSKKEKKGAKKVNMIKDNKIIKTFNSVTEASLLTGVCLSNIALCAGKKRGMAGGFKWEYYV